MRVLWLTATILLLDQISKIVVVQTMYRGQSIALLGDWLKLTYTGNPGMAFGFMFGPPGMITIFSILATLLIVYYLWKVRREYLPYRYSLALILGGALGNIIDRVFYGRIFGNNPWFQGEVVDFIHVNVWRGYIPEAVPIIGGAYTALFPIWNVADMAIVVGVVGILIFQRHFHDHAVAQMEAMEEVKPEAISGEETIPVAEERTPIDSTEAAMPPATPEVAAPEATDLTPNGAGPIELTVDPSADNPLRRRTEQ